jgi:hypothetical protein
VPSRIPVSAHLHKIVVDRSLGRFPSPLEQGRPQYIVVMIKHAQQLLRASNSGATSYDIEIPFSVYPLYIAPPPLSLKLSA